MNSDTVEGSLPLSRHGIFPNRHDDYTPLSSSAIPSDTPATCVAYLRALRAAIRGGAEWRAAIDSLRETTNELWLRLPIEEKKRFRRHLQRRWDVVRHRMAPPIADIIESELRNGTLEIREGHLKTVDASPAGAHITLRAHDDSESFYADRVINCTGPSMNYRRIPSTLLQNLFKQRTRNLRSFRYWISLLAGWSGHRRRWSRFRNHLQPWPGPPRRPY